MALHKTIPHPTAPTKSIDVPLTDAEEAAERERWRVNAEAKAARRAAEAEEARKGTLSDRVAALERAAVK